METGTDKQAVENLVALGEIHGTRAVLEQIANKWSVLMLTVLCSEPSRFNAIKRRLDPITHKALTEALRRLERAGLTIRCAPGPPAVQSRRRRQSSR